MHTMLVLLNAAIQKQYSAIDQWIINIKGARKWPIYHSLDLRSSTKKICHVDSNLFPAGFHNITINDANTVISLLRRRMIDVHKVVLVIENFTRNVEYMRNVAILKKIILQSLGMQGHVVIATIDAEQELSYLEYDDAILEVHRIYKKDGKSFVMLDGQRWYPELFVLNNDLTGGLPTELADIEQMVLPNLYQGWFHRRKSIHFQCYNQLMEELSKKFLLNTDLITTKFSVCDGINFKTKEGFSALKEKMQHTLSEIATSYYNNHIDEQPYLFLKADRGTFGMGIMNIDNIEDIDNINKKNRHSLYKIKQGMINSEVLIQEGIQTVKIHQGNAAELMLYSVDGEIISEMVRFVPNKNSKESLNTSTMQIEATQDRDINYDPVGYIKWLINKMANLACTLEL